MLNGTNSSFPQGLSFDHNSRLDGFADTVRAGTGVDIVLAEAGQFLDFEAADEWLLP